jgi:predicted PurR-regulated permease PerM
MILPPATGDAPRGIAMSRMVSFLVLVAILVVIALVFIRVMAGFFVPLFLAALLGVVIQPLYRWALAKCQGYRYVASTFTTGLVLIAVLLPIGLVVTTATLEGLSLIDQLQLGNVRSKLDELRRDFGLQIPREGDIRRIETSLRRWRDQQRNGESIDLKAETVDNLLQRVAEIDKWLAEQGDAAPVADTSRLKESLQTLRDATPESVQRDDALLLADAEFRELKRNLFGGTYRAWLTDMANPSDERLDEIRKAVLATAGPVLSLGSGTLVFLGKMAFGVVIMVVALFFLLAEGSRMLDAIVRVSPLEEQYVRELVNEFDRACRAIVSATLLSAVAQGLLAGIGFYFAGLQSSVALLMLLTMVAALVPFIGAVAVWAPVCVYLYLYQGQGIAAIALAAYGGLIVSQADNVIKPYVLHGQSNLHPLLALLSVLGGLQALGPIGILVGPMVVVFLQVLLRLVQREMSSLDRTSWSTWPGFAAFTKAGAKPPAEASSHAETSPPAASTTEPTAGGNGPAGNGDSARGQPQHAGKKRRK